VDRRGCNGDRRLITHLSDQGGFVVSTEARSVPRGFIVDAHQHFWNPVRVPYPWLGPELAPIDRPFEFDQLAPILARTGVNGTVLVQSADNDQDTDYMLAVAEEHPQILAVVGYVPLDRPDEAARRLEELQNTESFVGVRNLIHNQPDPDYLVTTDVLRGLGRLSATGLSMDIVSVIPRHLEHVPTIAARYPELRLVIDHLSKPPIKRADWEPWRTLISHASRYPNVYAKVSGLYPSVGSCTDWTADDLRPFVDFALELFGSQRLMYGGDWPISVLNGGYDKVWNELSVIFDELSPDDRDNILSRTALEFYRVPSSRVEAVLQ
jgi:L-fuconolactonase